MKSSSYRKIPWILIFAVGSAVLMLFGSRFLGWFLAGAVLSELTRPIHSSVKEHVGASVSAAFSVSSVFLVAAATFGILGAYVASDAAAIVSQAQSFEVSSLDQVSQYLTGATGFDPELSDRVPGILSSAASSVAAGFSGIMSFAASTLVGITVMVFTQFYLLRDGQKLVKWFESLGLVRQDDLDRFLEYNKAALWSVFEGHVLMAFAMAILVGTGMILVGIPNSFFWTFVMMILGLVPLIGTAVIWVPSVLYLVFSQQLVPALLLLVYAGFVTTIGDNLLRPYLVGESDDMHPFYVLIGVIGGAAIFGPVGLFVGPPVFSVVKTSLEAVSRD